MTWAAVLRRGWVVPIVAALTTLVAVEVKRHVPERYTAQAVLTVSAVPGRNAAPVDQANGLATTYARIIEIDPGVLRYVSRAVSQPASAVERQISIVHHPDTPLLRLRFRADDGAVAVEGANALVHAVTGGSPVASAIAPNSVESVRPATSARRAGSGAPPWRAEAVVIASPDTATSSLGDSTNANALAKTYADLIPQDHRVLDRVAAAVGLSSGAVGTRISVSNDFETALVRLAFRASTPQEAVQGARALATAVSGPEPASPRIAPRSLQPVSLPVGAAEDFNLSHDVIPIGVALGICLGLVLFVAWERSDPRIDDVQTLSAEAFCPASSTELMTDEAVRALVSRWGHLVSRRPAQIALVPCEPRLRPDAADVVEAFAGVSDDTFVAGGVPGGVDASEHVAMSSDLVALVAAPGTRVADVRATVRLLEQFGAPPRWALLTPTSRFRRRRARRTAPVASPADTEGAAYG